MTHYVVDSTIRGQRGGRIAPGAAAGRRQYHDYDINYY